MARLPTVSAQREAVSVITVFNDLETRRACLDRSIEHLRDQAPDLEYLPIDNTDGSFDSAGAALNHGAAQATRDFVVCVHQDVYLHSLEALEEAAAMLARDDSIGLLGAVGPDAKGRFFGRIRDRVFLLGAPAPEPTVVDCVDEVLFIVSRRALAREPLSEAPELAWHAYAVEYGLRTRARRAQVCAANIPLTHNSLTVNLERLEVAYETLAGTYPDVMPVMTPQGLVGGGPRLRDRITVLEEHRWRFRWLVESRAARAGRQAADGSPCVLTDIRLDIDALLARVPDDKPLLVVNVDSGGFFTEDRRAPLTLTRMGRRLLLTSAKAGEIPRVVADSPSSGPVLVTNLDLDDVRALAARLPGDGRILGYRTSTGYWMLIGAEPAMLPAEWLTPQATPVGMSALGAVAASAGDRGGRL